MFSEKCDPNISTVYVVKKKFELIKRDRGVTYLSYLRLRIITILGGLMPELFHVDPMLPEQVPEGPSVFLCGMRCLGDVALVSKQKALQVCSLELGNDLCLRLLKGYLFRVCFCRWKINVNFSDYVLF